MGTWNFELLIAVFAPDGAAGTMTSSPERKLGVTFNVGADRQRKRSLTLNYGLRNAVFGLTGAEESPGTGGRHGLRNPVKVMFIGSSPEPRGAATRKCTVMPS